MTAIVSRGGDFRWDMNPYAKEFVPPSFVSKSQNEPSTNGDEDTGNMTKVICVFIVEAFPSHILQKPLATGFQESWEDNLSASEERLENNEEIESEHSKVSNLSSVCSY